MNVETPAHSTTLRGLRTFRLHELRWRPAVALEGLSARLRGVAARAPAAIVLALLALVLMFVFAPTAGAPL